MYEQCSICGDPSTYYYQNFEDSDLVVCYECLDYHEEES